MASEKPHEAVWEETSWRPECIDVHFEEYGPERDLARRTLAAAAPEMARLLLGMIDGAPHDHCPACGELTCCRDVPHEPDCRLVAVLRKAGVRP